MKRLVASIDHWLKCKTVMFSIAHGLHRIFSSRGGSFGKDLKSQILAGDLLLKFRAMQGFNLHIDLAFA